MNILLIFFALPIAIIILSAIFETILKSPIKIAGIVFSIFLIISFVYGGIAEYLVATIIYTLISYITAYIVCIIKYRLNNTVYHQEPMNTGYMNENVSDNSYTAQISEKTIGSNIDNNMNCYYNKRYR